ncbi:pyrimidine 5'-nucleotidase [Sulfitobacter sp. M368]|uniref:pyrimidine 5'-nucleotidase n=1 Tax=Sulfitobacter sp. M368 TaxID=2867021 RepID=UPI0021A3B9F7|nr:pyrimidine 5'-nucleotidase [Sulfitobacter sp. M368]UWR16692.1 pyrimidine 5'-nucleotidase [Sulfitobacter sp. M368]
MPRDAFSHVDTWVFDLDNTLYPPEARLFDLIEVRMTNWVMQELKVDQPEADRLRRKYWHEHGTTLAGLMREHDIDPAPYLVDVHDISMDSLTPDPDLAAEIRSLPGRRIVYTNGCAPYAERVLAARGLSGLFDAVYGVEHADFLPKPDRAAFDKVFATDGLNPASAAMFEDDARNLSAPFEMGMRTVHVAPARQHAAHIHYHTDDLRGFLGQVKA